MTEFYTPRGIKYTIPQIKWLLAHLDLLQLGYWPPETSCYVDAPSMTRKYGAYFEVPIQILAELKDRLDRCVDRKGCKCGDMLIARYALDQDNKQIARDFGLDEDTVERKCRQVLRYCRGNDRKHVSFHEFNWHLKS